MSELVKELNQLLSDYHIYYQNTRGFHWNIKGKNFFELHVKFEEFYTEALTTIDEVAERILTIGGAPLHTFEDYQKMSTLNVYKDVSRDEDAVNGIISQLGQLIKQENKVKTLAAEKDDSETEDMMIGLINVQQKNLWMLNSWLGK
ncbi:MAG: DNA starvation/stationary phase protection protein [Cyclobacteriaceae bacterium]|nr:DNA starvation/stationary phase protection protein [Cyclobacteriaceae bacterium HetDA_MAG_MS6]